MGESVFGEVTSGPIEIMGLIEREGNGTERNERRKRKKKGRGR